MIIGVIGGVASGKSFVASKLASIKQCLLIDADAIAKQKLADVSVVNSLIQKFGSDVLGSDGRIDRKALASRVFGETARHTVNRHWLNDLIHPLVRAEINTLISEQQVKSPDAWIILDVPLLVESGWDQICDHVLFVDTSERLRNTYAIKRGWGAAELAKREQSQISIEEKRNRATDIVVNSGVESELDASLSQWLSNL